MAPLGERLPHGWCTQVALLHCVHAVELATASQRTAHKHADMATWLLAMARPSVSSAGIK